MSDDIPQDQVEAVARVLCPPDMHYVCAPQPGFPCSACRSEALAAIRVLTPLIAAVERERCAQIAEDHATAARAYAPEDTEATHVSAARSIAFDIRSVKGAVT